jgi:plasmid stabilization system protein ParE
MIYDVILSSEAKQSLDDHIRYIAVEKQEPVNAERWLKKALRAVDTLSVFPNRCPIAAESKFSKHTIRMLIIDSCSFLYRVDEDSKTVRVTGFFHGGMARPE